MPEEFLSGAENVDIGVAGEGEYVMLDIVKMHEEQKKIEEIQGIVYRKGGEIVQTRPRPLIKDLDELPYPAYHLVDMEHYLSPEKIE